MNFNPAHLRRLMDDAIQKGIEDKRLLQMEAELVRKRAQEACMLKAQAIMLELPAKAKNSAMEGNSSVAVYRLLRDDTVDGNPYTSAPCIRLGSVADHLRALCREAGFEPTVEYSYDSGGTDSWNDIVIHW